MCPEKKKQLGADVDYSSAARAAGIAVTAPEGADSRK